eukprot:m.83941 g.83941  ORF g.83941 m.83941 type:complete len:271 (+) comp11255_c0_seq2:397-1209(+)
MGRGKHKAHRGDWLQVPREARRRTLSEPTSVTPDCDGLSHNGTKQRERAGSMGGRAVRFNVDNLLHVYPADPNVKLAAKRAKIPRRFDGPEWSIYKALRERKRTASECSARSEESERDGEKLTPPESPEPGFTPLLHRDTPIRPIRPCLKAATGTRAPGHSDGGDAPSTEADDNLNSTKPAPSRKLENVPTVTVSEATEVEDLGVVKAAAPWSLASWMFVLAALVLLGARLLAPLSESGHVFGVGEGEASPQWTPGVHERYVDPLSPRVV